ncbi:MAG: hypothetical protein HYY93_14150 [Planctomycetes bacterium]|nr:hypothetical protein [Planctomycetota bacterium]
MNWRSTGHADRASPVLCEVERLLMPVVDEVANRLWRRRHPTFLHKQYNPAYPVLSLAESLVLRRSEAFHV